MNCPLCGQSYELLVTNHPECLRLHTEGLRLLHSTMYQAIIASGSNAVPQAYQKCRALAASHYLRAFEVADLYVQAWNEAAEYLFQDGRPSPAVIYRLKKAAAFLDIPLKKRKSLSLRSTKKAGAQAETVNILVKIPVALAETSVVSQNTEWQNPEFPSKDLLSQEVLSRKLPSRELGPAPTKRQQLLGQSLLWSQALCSIAEELCRDSQKLRRQAQESRQVAASLRQALRQIKEQNSLFGAADSFAS